MKRAVRTYYMSVQLYERMLFPRAEFVLFVVVVVAAFVFALFVFLSGKRLPLTNIACLNTAYALEGRGNWSQKEGRLT